MSNNDNDIKEQTSVSVQSTEEDDLQLDLLKRPDFIVEANFMNIPIFNFDRNGKSGKSDTAIYHFSEAADRDSAVVRKVIVSVSKKEVKGVATVDSLPNAFDHDVWLVIMDFWDEQGRSPTGKVYFKMVDILKRLTVNTDSGKNYKRVMESISKLARTKIEAKNAFYSITSAKNVNRIIPLLQDCYMQTTSTKSRKQNDLSYVTLSEPVLENLRGNYTARINRRLYQQLEHGFAKRLSNLITYRKQKKQEYGNFDFEVTELAQLLPMNLGKIYPSKVMERLKLSLSELENKNMFTSEVIKTEKGSVLRLSPMNGEDNLIGVENIGRFMVMFNAIYGQSVESVFDFSPTDLNRHLRDYTRIFDFEGRRYSWIFHVLTVLVHQVKHHGYKADHGLANLAIAMFRKEEIKIPHGFKSLDVAYEFLAKKKEAIVAAQNRERQIQLAEEAIVNLSKAYVNKLTPEAKKRYLAELRREFDHFKKVGDDSPSLLAALENKLAKEMKHGEQLDII